MTSACKNGDRNRVGYARLVRSGLNRSPLATRARTLTSETILRPGSNNFSVGVRVGVRFPFKLLIQSRMAVSGSNIEKRLVCILYMIRDCTILWTSSWLSMHLELASAVGSMDLHAYTFYTF